MQCAVLFVISIEKLGFALKTQLINFTNGTHMNVYIYEGLKYGKFLTKHLICFVFPPFHNYSIPEYMIKTTHEIYPEHIYPR